MSENHHIFLSYRSTEADFAVKLAADLKNTGVKLWMDRLDIKLGQDWRSELEEAVSNCSAFIAIVSPDYVTSRYCRRELARADRLKRPILPVLISPLGEHEVPFEIERQQHTDFTNWRSKEIYQQQLQELVNLIQERFSDQVTNAPNKEIRYLTSLIADLETNKGLIDHLITTPDDDEESWLPPNIVRPEPHSAKAWMTYSPFNLLHEMPGSGSLSTRYRRITTYGITDIVDQHERFVLMGEPGSGKTTVLQHLVMDAVHAYQSQPEINPMPFLVRLADWDEQATLDEFFRSQWPLDTDITKLMQRSGVSVFLDGLNEMTSNQYARLEMVKDWLASDTAPQHVILTDRGQSQLSDLGLPIVQIAPLGLAQIEQFVTNYLDSDSAEILLNRLLPTNEIEQEQKRHLMQMAANPFVLSAIMLVYKNSSHGELPDNTGLLLRQLSRELWRRTSNQQAQMWVSLEELETALAELAAAMIEDHMGVYAPLNYAVERMGTRMLIEAAAEAGFVEIRQDHVRFKYQHSQCFFAALNLLHNGDLQERLAPPVLDAGGRRQSSPWDQVIVVYAGIVANPDITLVDIAQTNPFLALESIASGINVTEETVEQIVAQLLQIMRVDEHESQVATAQALITIDYDMAISILLDAMRAGPWDVRQTAASTLWQTDVPMLSGLVETLQDLEYELQSAATTGIRQLGDTALPTLIHLLRSPSWKLRRGSAWALGHIRHPAAVPALAETLHDEDNLVCTEAAIALGCIRDAAAIPHLVQTMRHHNSRVRKAAARALHAMGPEATQALLDGLEDDDDDIRRLAIGALKGLRGPAVIDALLEATYDNNVEVRAAAIDALEMTEEPEVVKRLVALLTDQSKTRWTKQRISDLAAHVLRQIGTPEALNALETPQVIPSANTAADRLKGIQKLEQNSDTIKQLSDPDWTVRREAAHALAGNEEPLAVLSLLKAINDDVREVRMAVVHTLGTIDDEVAHNALLQCLHDADADFREVAAVELTRIGTPIVPGLGRILANSEPLVRRLVIGTLGKIATPSAVSILRQYLTDDSLIEGQPTSQIVIAALSAINTEDAVNALHDRPLASEHRPAARQPQPEPTASEHRELLLSLLDELHNADWVKQQEAAKALREYARALRGTHDDMIIQRLSDALNDDEWVIRWAAAEAFAWIGDTASVPLLMDKLDDSYWMVRIAVIRALLEIGDPVAISGIISTLNDTNSMVREASAEALGALGQPAAIPALTKALTDTESLVRLAAATALGRITDSGTTEPLLKALADADDHVRWAAAQALVRTSTESAVPVLIALLDDTAKPYWEEQRVCDLVADALLHIGTPEALNAVQQWRAAS